MPILDHEPSAYPCTLLTDLAAESQQTEELSKQQSNRVWWTVYTRSRQEKALARQLYGYHIPFYLPLVGQDHYYRGRKVRSFLPMFSGYLFLYGNEDERIMMLTTNRISRILPVHDQNRLRRDLMQIHQLIEANQPMTIEQRLQPGRQVRIKSGPMKGLEGVIIERRGKNRLLVAIEYIQQGVSVDIDDYMVEAA